MLRSKNFLDMQTPCSSRIGRPDPLSVQASAAPVGRSSTVLVIMSS
jgi:hypothetical protein